MLITITQSAFSLALALVSVLGALQGLNALLNSSASREKWSLDDSLYLTRGKIMHGIQGALVGVIAIFIYPDGCALCAVDARRRRDRVYDPGHPGCRGSFEEQDVETTVGIMLNKWKDCAVRLVPW